MYRSADQRGLEGRETSVAQDNPWGTRSAADCRGPIICSGVASSQRRSPISIDAFNFARQNSIGFADRGSLRENGRCAMAHRIDS